MPLLDHMCPSCQNQMPMEMGEELERICRVCGIRQPEKKGIVMETILHGKASEAQKVLLNEQTWEDPRIPHLKTLKCPNAQCSSRTAGTESDVGQIRSDMANMKQIQRCQNCETQWRSRG